MISWHSLFSSKMTDLSTIRVIPFCGKVDEWPIWSEKFLSKAKRCGFKELLLGKWSIPRADEEIDITSDTGKEKSRIIEMNDIAFTELILSIDVTTSSGKTAFNLVKGCKTKDHPDGNAASAWERLKNKYEPVSAPTLVKLEKQFRELSLKKGQDPEVWITELEDLRVRLETMGSSISENQFMIHILNNLTSDYELQLAMMERRVGDINQPLTVEEIKGELNLRFERLNARSGNSGDGEILEEQALFSGQFKGKCRSCGLIGHKAFQCKNRAINNGGNNGNSNGGIFCSYCRKTGHDKRNCHKLKKKEARNNNPSNNNGNVNRQNYESQDVVFTATSKNETLSDDIWICDSGACGHYCKSIEGMFDIRDIAETITVGNGDSMMATKVGSLKRRVVQLDGSTLDVTINEVKYVPDLCVNLFSINKAIKTGFNLSNNGTTICLTKGSASIAFDRVIKTLSGSISGIKMVCKESSVAYTAQHKTELRNSIDINKFHEMLGHCGSDRLKRTAMIHGLKLKGELKVCEDCAIAKARQKNVNQDWKEGSQKPGERVYLDISSIKDKSYSGSRFWVLVVDDYTDYCWSLFLKSKSDLKTKFKTLLSDLNVAGINVKYIRCDDSGENKALFEECQSKGYGINFEFSGPRTPQRNGKVERKFQTFFGRIRAMLNSAGLKDHLRSGVWAECAMTVTFLSNITSIKNRDICPYQLMFGCKPKLPTSLRSFGEMGVVTTKDKIQGKLSNRGTPCMFVGYSVYHAHDVYRMLNLKTEMIINSRDIIWLNEMHKDWIGRKMKTQSIHKDDDDDVMESRVQSVTDNQDDLQGDTNLDELKRMKVYRQMRQLESSFNPEATKLVEQIEQGREILLE